MATNELVAETGNGRPLVSRAISNRAPWIFSGVLALAAIGLFTLLESQRTAVIGVATEPVIEASGGFILPPPELSIPGEVGAVADDVLGPDVLTTAPSAPSFIPRTLPGVPSGPNERRFAPTPPAPIVQLPPYMGPVPSAPAIDPQSPSNPPADGAASDDAGPPGPAGRPGTMTRIANPSTTIPQGALIHAVLETALDSNRPGFARAIVSRDVRSFDGTRILIPRGSRLFGEYKADLVDGQNRAFILWQRLTRPDGSQMLLESPAADPLGRAGVGGKVNTHFFTRFAGTILQSALDIGVGMATRRASDGTVVVGLPGSSQTLINPAQATIKPTLKVRHGSSVSVFVARDLDFGPAG
jgi:type IV secretion system protein VirB10